MSSLLHSLWLYVVFLTDLIKVILYINVGVQQILSVWGQIHLVEDQILKGLLQVSFPDEHCSNHASCAENHLEKRHSVFALCLMHL